MKMTSKIYAHLNFNGKCREAMTYYQECFGGELTFQKVSESPMAVRLSSEAGASILHSSLVNNDLVLLASDVIGETLISGNKISLSLNCTSDEEVTAFFRKLSKEGEIKTPLHQTFWGARYGKLTDKFGIEWVFNYSKINPPQKTGSE